MSDDEPDDEPEEIEEAGEGSSSSLASMYETDDEDRGEDIFAGIYGHEGAKAIVGAALRQGDTHVLLEGPPGSGKSAFLLALESHVPGVIYRDGDQITASKLRDVLKDDPPILLIDEIDALDNKTYDTLSTPMEHGRIVRDSARESYDVNVGTQIIAACNDQTQIAENIRNRFRTLQFERYDETEYVDLCAKMLPTEVDWMETEDEARSAAEKIKKITGRPDPRDARDIARMAGSLEEIDVIAAALEDPDADIENKPLYARDIARAKGEVGKQHLRQVLTEEMVESSRSDADEGEVSDEEQAAVESDIEAAVEEAVEAD